MLGNLGDMAGMFGKVKQMQKDLKETQEKIAKIEVISQSVDDLVKVVVTGDFTVKQIVINPECVQNVEQLEDLVLSTVNKAITEAKNLGKEEIDKITGGINIPGLF